LYINGAVVGLAPYFRLKVNFKFTFTPFSSKASDCGMSSIFFGKQVFHFLDFPENAFDADGCHDVVDDNEDSAYHSGFAATERDKRRAAKRRATSVPNDGTWNDFRSPGTEVIT
jgi:hypothetical protein